MYTLLYNVPQLTHNTGRQTQVNVENATTAKTVSAQQTKTKKKSETEDWKATRVLHRNAVGGWASETNKYIYRQVG